MTGFVQFYVRLNNDSTPVVHHITGIDLIRKCTFPMFEGIMYDMFSWHGSPLGVFVFGKTFIAMRTSFIQLFSG
jgi:hypothetical protein